MVNFNKESFFKKIVSLVASVMCIVHIIFLQIYPIDPWIFLNIHLAFGITIVLLVRPAIPTKNDSASEYNPNVFDIIGVILAIITAIYFISQVYTIPFRIVVKPTNVDLVFSYILVILVLEITRRTFGNILPIIAIIFMFYAKLGKYLPGVLGHRGYDWSTIISQGISQSAIFGVSLSASAYYVFLLILFTTFLSLFGAGEFFMDLAIALTGRQRGGPAKVAVISSALFGTLSGSAVVNVITTGSITIPLMKKIGYKPEFAGAVEAVASTGGQIMPPIMGSAVFIMAQLIGSDYLSIMLVSIIPAFLYFLSVFIMIDMEAGLTGLKSMKKEEIPLLKEVIRKRGYLALPILTLVYFLVIVQTSVIRSAMAGILALFIITFFRSETRISISKIIDGFTKTAISASSLIAGCACAGLVVGIVFLTGIGFKFSQLLILVSGGNTLIVLSFAAITALVLGMGLPTTACYLICAAVVAPALISLGFMPLIAHLFVFYFACLSAISPPVALAAYTGAALAKAAPFTTSMLAVKLGLVSFLIPFIFAYSPEILGIGSIMNISLSVMTAIIGIVFLSAGLEGYWIGNKRVTLISRIILITSSILAIQPGLLTDMFAFALIIPVFIIEKYFKEKKSK